MVRTRSAQMVLRFRLQITPRQRVVDLIQHDIPLNKYHLEEYHFQQNPQRQNQHLYYHLDLQRHIQQHLHYQIQMRQLEATTFKRITVKTNLLRFLHLQRLIQIMLHVGGIVPSRRQDQRTLSRRSRSFRTTSSQALIWAR